MSYFNFICPNYKKIYWHKMSKYTLLIENYLQFLFCYVSYSFMTSHSRLIEEISAGKQIVRMQC